MLKSHGAQPCCRMSARLYHRSRSSQRGGRRAEVAGADGTIRVGGAGDAGQRGQSDGAAPTGWPVRNGGDGSAPRVRRWPRSPPRTSGRG